MKLADTEKKYNDIELKSLYEISQSTSWKEESFKIERDDPIF